MKYKTCISIGEDTTKKIRAKLKVALKKSDYVEIRLDFLTQLIVLLLRIT